jgi:hypothetical protein
MRETNVPVQSGRSPMQPGTGAGLLGLAFRRAMVSQLHPKMLMALFLPFIIAFLGGIIVLWVFWSPLTDWLNVQVAGWDFINQFDTWLLALGLFSIKVYMVPVLAAGILLPASGILGLVISAIFVMPLVLRHLEKREYQGLKRQGHYSSAVGIWNAVWVGLLFSLGWLLTMPLWLIPPLPVVLPVVWWAFAFTRMLRVDAIIEHASAKERRIIWRRHNRELWTLGLVLSLINLFPPAWLVLPVFSALVFAHFSLEALRRLRADPVIDV